MRTTATLKTVAGIAVVVLAAYAALGFLLAPWLIGRYLPAALQARLGQAVTIGHVRVNPFVFSLDVRDVRVGGGGAGPAPVALGALYVDFDPLASGFGRGWVLGDVRIQDAQVHAELDRAGRLDLAQLAAGSRGEPSRGEPPRIVLRHVLVEAAADVRVLSQTPPASLAAGPVRLEAFDVATRPDRQGRYTLSARLADGASLTWRGDIALLPARSEGEIDVRGLKLATLWPLLRDRLGIAEPRGAVDAGARYRFEAANGEPQLTFEAVHVAASGVAVARPGAQAPLLAAASLALEGGRVDLAKRELSAERVAADRGSVRLARGADGNLELPALKATESAGDGKPWTYRVKSARASDFSVTYADRGLSPPLVYGLEDLAIEARNVAQSSAEPIAFQANGRIAAGGSVSAHGSAAQDFARADIDVELHDAALAPLQPLVARYASVRLESGNASASAHVAYRGADAEPALAAEGSVALTDVDVKDAASGERVLAWRRLDAGAARVTLGPARIAAKQVEVDGAHVRIAISRERKLNLAQLLKTGAPAARDGDAQDEAGTPIGIGGVRVRRSSVDFSDESLVLPFSARIFALHGNAVGLSSAPGRRTTLQLEGRIGKFGSATARGSLSLQAPTRFTDIAVAFENVDMPPLSPYSATFLGRKIAGGALWLDLDYRIARGELQGENRVTISNLALGERVDAPKALDAPVDLLIGLLTDSEGRLRAEVPVTGDVNDPKFDLAAVILAEAGDFVRRIVSAPFRALAGLVRGGRGQPELQTVDFDAGSARLEPAEREKLQAVARALAERPRLALLVPAPYDPQRDASALKDELVRRELARRLGRPAAPGEDPGPVAFGSPAAQRALEGMLEEGMGRDAVRTLAGWFAADRGGEPQRVNAFLRRPGDPEFYRSVFARLVSGQALPADAARALASRRAQAVIAYLRSTGVDSARLATGDIELAHGEGDAVAAPLALRAGAGGPGPAG